MKSSTLHALLKKETDRSAGKPQQHWKGKLIAKHHISFRLPASEVDARRILRAALRALNGLLDLSEVLYVVKHGSIKVIYTEQRLGRLTDLETNKWVKPYTCNLGVLRIAEPAK